MALGAGQGPILVGSGVVDSAGTSPPPWCGEEVLGYSAWLLE